MLRLVSVAPFHRAQQQPHRRSSQVMPVELQASQPADVTATSSDNTQILWHSQAALHRGIDNALANGLLKQMKLWKL